MVIFRRKIIWLMILMIWVGMVTSIIIYQGNDYFELEKTASSNIEILPEDELQNQGIIDTDMISLAQLKDKGEQKDFFVEYRLERDKARSEQINIFREMINNPNTDEATKKEAQKRMLELTDKMEKEMEIESLIRARGYKDALAYIHNEAVDVIIPTNGLKKEDVAKVGDIIVKVTGFSCNDVTIIEKKITADK